MSEFPDLSHFTRQDSATFDREVEELIQEALASDRLPHSNSQATDSGTGTRNPNSPEQKKAKENSKPQLSMAENISESNSPQQSGSGTNEKADEMADIDEILDVSRSVDMDRPRPLQRQAGTGGASLQEVQIGLQKAFSEKNSSAMADILDIKNGLLEVERDFKNNGNSTSSSRREINMPPPPTTGAPPSYADSFNHQSTSDQSAAPIPPTGPGLCIEKNVFYTINPVPMHTQNSGGTSNIPPTANYNYNVYQGQNQNHVNAPMPFPNQNQYNQMPRVTNPYDQNPPRLHSQISKSNENLATGNSRLGGKSYGGGAMRRNAYSARPSPRHTPYMRSRNPSPRQSPTPGSMTTSTNSLNFNMQNLQVQPSNTQIQLPTFQNPAPQPRPQANGMIAHTTAGSSRRAPTVKKEFKPKKESKRPDDKPKPFRCPHMSKKDPTQQCTSSFARQDELKRHMKIHNPNKPYKCQYCPMEFSRTDHLTTHTRTHTKEKPYKCQYEGCTKAFARSDERLRHHQVHSKREAKNKVKQQPVDASHSCNVKREAPKQMIRNTHNNHNNPNMAGPSTQPFNCNSQFPYGQPHGNPAQNQQTNNFYPHQNPGQITIQGQRERIFISEDQLQGFAGSRNNGQNYQQPNLPQSLNTSFNTNNQNQSNIDDRMTQSMYPAMPSNNGAGPAINSVQCTIPPTPYYSNHQSNAHTPNMSGRATPAMNGGYNQRPMNYVSQTPNMSGRATPAMMQRPGQTQNAQNVNLNQNQGSPNSQRQPCQEPMNYGL